MNIGIDHGYYAIKTRHCSFPAGLTAYGSHEPYTRQGLLESGGCFFNALAENRLEKSDLNKVPAELVQQYSSVDEIQGAMYEVAVKALPGVTAENTELHDVTLYVSEDGGKTWVKADESNFPKDGITVTLPYPDGTNAADYDFVVTHMTTVAMNGLAVGAVETPAVTKTEKGLQFTVYSLSPVAVSWKPVPKPQSTSAPAATAAPADTSGALYYTCPACGRHDWTATDAGYRCDDCGYLETVKQLTGYANVKGVYTPDTGKTPAAAAGVSGMPQTGDDTDLTLWLVLLAASGLALAGAALCRRKRG